MKKARNHSAFALALILATSLAIWGCSSQSADGNSEKGQQAANSGGILGKVFESKKPVTIPAGTPIVVTLDQTLASNQNRTGDDFDASLAQAVVVNGRTVIPKGARVRGRVLTAEESGRLHHVAKLQLALSSVEVGGRSQDIQTSAITYVGKDHKKRNIGMIGGGAGVGAIIGGIAGGGKGAAIGAAVGAGGGTAAAAATGKKDISVPAETPLTFKLREPVTVEIKS